MPNYVGIQLLQQKLDIYILPSGQSRVFPNTPEGVADLVSWLVASSQCHQVALSAPDASAHDLVFALRQANVSIVHASAQHSDALAQIRAMESEQADINVDAYLLAVVAQLLSKKDAQPPEALREWFLLRSDLIRECERYRIQLQRIEHAQPHAQLQTLIQTKQRQISQVESAVQATLAEC